MTRAQLARLRLDGMVLAAIPMRSSGYALFNGAAIVLFGGEFLRRWFRARRDGAAESELSSGVLAITAIIAGTSVLIRVFTGLRAFSGVAGACVVIFAVVACWRLTKKFEGGRKSRSSLDLNETRPPETIPSDDH